jgi:hypothetical protein
VSWTPEALADNDLVLKKKKEGVTVYEKIEFMQRYRNKILAAARNKKKREAIPTKRNAGGSKKSVTVTVKIPKAKNRATPITIDDLASFASVRFQGPRTNWPFDAWENGQAWRPNTAPREVPCGSLCRSILGRN